MSEWIPIKIGDLFEFSRSGEWGDDTGSGEPVGVLRSVNFSNDGKLNTFDIAYRHLPNTKLEKILMREGDILIEKSGGSLDQPAGRVVLSHITFPCTCSNFISLCRPKDKYDCSFIFYKLFNEYRTGRVVKFQQKTTGIINFKLSEYLNEIIQIPNEKREQTRIARILFSVDETIEKTDEAIEKYKAIKQAMINDLFTRGLDKHGKLRPTYKDAPSLYKKSEFGWIPAEWEVLRLEKVCSMQSGDGITSVSIQEFGAYPVYGGNGLRGYTSTYTHDGDFVLIGRQGALCGNVTRVTNKFYASEHAVVVSVFSNVSVDWLFFILGAMNLNRHAEASAQPGLSVAKILNLLIKRPSYEEQKLIAQKLIVLDSMIETEYKALYKNKQLKQSLMSDLLSGEVPVKA